MEAQQNKIRTWYFCFEEWCTETVLGGQDQRLCRDAYFDPPIRHAGSGLHQLFWN
jgi:hypothetical protein